MEKKISIIVPCHNVEKYIERCVDSLVNQTIGLSALEIILVDDASEDRTREYLYDYQKKYPQSIFVIALDENVRQGGARNRGLEIASAPYIGFVDADDWTQPDMYEKMYHKAAAYNCDIVFCRNVRDDGSGTKKAGRTGLEDRFLLIDSKEKREEFIASDLIGGGVWDKIYKREIIFENRIRFLEKLAYEDIHWGAIFYLYAVRVYIIEDRLYHYFVNHNSTVLSRNQKYHYDFFKVNLLKMEEYEARGAWKEYKEAVEYDFLLTYYIAGIKLLAHRFDAVLYEVFYEMQNTIRALIPEYKKNKYLNRDAGEMYKLLITLIDQPLKEADIDQVLEMARKVDL